MNNRRRCLLLVVLLGLLTNCTSAASQPTDVSIAETVTSPASTSPAPDTRFPLAQPLSEDTVRGLDDEVARQMLLQDREQAAAGSRFENSILGPRLVPDSPARLIPGWNDAFEIPLGQPLTGYLNITAIAKGKPEHEFLVTLLVDYQQVPFELGGHLAPTHVLRLPAWKPQTYRFSLPQPLPAGRHELIVLVHDDPYNLYARHGVLEKLRRGGKITFDTAAGRPFSRSIAIRFLVVVGDERETPWARINCLPNPFEPQKTDLLNVPLLLRLTEDETNSLMGAEPAVVVGSQDSPYAFVYYNPFSLLPDSLLKQTTAALVAILDGQQVRINDQEALLFPVQAGQRYRIPLQVEWPPEVNDGQVHALYVIITFGAGHNWLQEARGQWLAIGFQVPYGVPPVMVVPERSLIEYLWAGDDEGN